MAFQKATRKNAKARIAITGPSGSGKTKCALILAGVLGKKVAVLDSERKSASLYADEHDFDVEELEDFHIQTYLAAISNAAAEGYDVLVVDSWSHSWASAMETLDKMGGWTRAGKVITPLVRSLVDAILTYPGHVICTMRSKTEHVLEKDEKTGKTTIRKMGMAPQARGDTEYEFTIVIDLDHGGTFGVSKSRCGDKVLAMGGVYDRNTEIPKFGQRLIQWLNAGAALTPAQALRERLRFAADDAAVSALRPELLALKPVDLDGFRACAELYKARKVEFTEAAQQSAESEAL